MSFPDAIKSVLSQYATFDGRARRSEFWFWYLANAVVGMIFGILAMILVIPTINDAMDQASAGPDATVDIDFPAGVIVLYVIAFLYGLAVLLPTLAVSVRRLHDQDKSGFFWFLGLIPFVGGIILIVFYALPGTTGPNRFGPDPKLAKTPVYSAAV